MSARRVRIAPSILSADFAALGAAIAAAEKGGADFIHVDVMDGHFVPNITIGPAVVKSIKRVARVPLDVHLMISDPDKYAEAFVDAGADIEDALQPRLLVEELLRRHPHDGVVGRRGPGPPFLDLRIRQAGAQAFEPGSGFGVGAADGEAHRVIVRESSDAFVGWR